MADVYGGRVGVSLDFPIAASSPWPGFPHAALMAWDTQKWLIDSLMDLLVADVFSSDTKLLSGRIW